MENVYVDGILSATDFAQFATNWTAALETASDSQLKAFFWTKAARALPYVSLPIAQLVRLVSTVGSTQIKARFLLRPTDEADEQAAGRPKLQFTLALFATDALGTRLSSYYLAAGSYGAAPGHAAAENPASPGAAQPAAGLQQQVDHALVAGWLQLWATIDTPASPHKLRITPALFKGNYGPMQGYTFDTSDFLQPLFYVKAFNDQQQVRLYLALHEYYRPTPEGHDELAHTLGLVVRVIGPGTDPTATGGGVGSAGDATYFYDMSKPCPPTC